MEKFRPLKSGSVDSVPVYLSSRYSIYYFNTLLEVLFHKVLLH